MELQKEHCKLAEGGEGPVEIFTTKPKLLLANDLSAVSLINLCVIKKL